MDNLDNNIKMKSFFNNNDDNSSLEDSDSDLDDDQKEIFFSNKKVDQKQNPFKSEDLNIALKESENINLNNFEKIQK